MDNFNNIAGYKREKAQLSQIRRILQNMDEYKAQGIQIPKGVLLHGEPGLGKTLMAKSLATDGIASVELRAADCVGDDSAEKIVDAFKRAKEQAPSVLIIDELDKIAGESSRFYKDDCENVSKILLQEIDSKCSECGIIVVATCNDKHSLNPALLRSGRFDRVFKIRKPTLDDRAEIIKMYFDRISLQKDVEVGDFAMMTGGFTCAQIECMINEAAILAKDAGRDSITRDDLTLAMNRVSMSELEGEYPDEAQKRITAVHEAGHALVAMTLCPNDITDVSIVPHGPSRGRVRVDFDSMAIKSVREMENQITIALAGRAAEHLIFGEYYVGSYSDLAQAQGILGFLTQQVGAYGFEYISSTIRSPYSDGIAASEQLVSRIENLMLSIMNQKNMEATAIIQKHRALFDVLVSKLIEQNTLSKSELMTLHEQYIKVEKASIAVA